MKILTFRPYKRMKDCELIHFIYHTFDQMKDLNLYDEENLWFCDQLIREAKLRKLRCSKEILYNRILYK